MAMEDDGVLVAWVRDVVGEDVTLVRAVVRREGWIVQGRDQRWFLRLGRDEDPANPPAGVIAEGELIRELHRVGLLVPDVIDVFDGGGVLYAWVPGTADIDSEPPERQQLHLNTYLEQLARLHTLDLNWLDLKWMSVPRGPRECALAHADAVYEQMGGLALEPLSTFGIQWLRNHAPDDVERLSVLHGDAGVGNFLVTEDEFRGVIDWEWAHIGDPMEDLGSVVMHAGFHPIGDLAEAFARYEAAGGARIDISKVKYYAAHLYVRSVIALSAHVAHLDPHNPVALNLAYKLVNDRLTCLAIADAMGTTLEEPELFDDDADNELTFYGVIAVNLTDDVVPATTSAMARDRAAMAARLVLMLERRERWGATIEAVERDELSRLLGESFDDVESGLRLLDDRLLTTWATGRETEVLRYLYRRAVRAGWLARPVESLFPDRTIAAL
jgi:aminoglycoside phosphotransferase (APT) family kinase protein